MAPVAAEYDALEAQRKSVPTPDYRDLRASVQRSQLSTQLLTQMLDLGRTRWAPLQAKYTKAALDTIAKHTTATTRTDVNGHFEVPTLQPGTYFLYANHTIFKNVLFWLVPVDLQSKSKMSLSNSNAKSSILRGRTYN